MSVEPQALERSVLERKERDELAAIAEAMGVKAGARTSKANLIGQILREAGIETGEDKPKRSAKAKSGNGAGRTFGLSLLVTVTGCSARRGANSTVTRANTFFPPIIRSHSPTMVAGRRRVSR